ncbi:MAG: cysteine synthase A, partial [Clostridia bacterium]|nr:cysteine synthase A [Clostridia bacterium]
KSVGEAVGGTPLMESVKLEKEYNLEAKLLLKLEFMNPAGSVKDRVALEMIEDAEKSGVLKSGATIIEPTSGNTGIGLASIGASRGYKIIIVMPDTMSEERRSLISAYGAELVLTDGKKGMAGAVEEAERLNSEIPGSIIAGQFSNPANPQAHRKTTGVEIWEDTDGQVDIFVAGVGTGGTLSGVGEYLKTKNPDIKIVAVEPEGSPLISKGTAGAHGIQGIGANFIPENLNTEIYDEVITVSDEDAFEFAKLLARKEGLLAGISSGAALCAGIELAKREENKGKNIVVLLPDSGSRYVSIGIYD